MKASEILLLGGAGLALYFVFKPQKEAEDFSSGGGKTETTLIERVFTEVREAINIPTTPQEASGNGESFYQQVLDALKGKPTETPDITIPAKDNVLEQVLDWLKAGGRKISDSTTTDIINPKAVVEYQPLPDWRLRVPSGEVAGGGIKWTMPSFKVNTPSGQPISEWFWGGTGKPGNVPINEGFGILGQNLNAFFGFNFPLARVLKLGFAGNLHQLGEGDSPIEDNIRSREASRGIPDAPTLPASVSSPRIPESPASYSFVNGVSRWSSR